MFREVVALSIDVICNRGLSFGYNMMTHWVTDTDTATVTEDRDHLWPLGPRNAERDLQDREEEKEHE